MESYNKQQKNYFHNNDLALEVYHRIFCDFENYPWDGSMESLQKVHDFCETSQEFSRLIDKLAYYDFQNQWKDDVYQAARDFIESLNDHLYINTHLKKSENEIWFSAKERSYIEKRVYAFIDYPNQKILQKIFLVKTSSKNILYFPGSRK